MSKNLIVNLVSAQTIPNIQFIKMFGNADSEYLFISTEQMIDQLQWIANASGVETKESVIVKSDSFNAIPDALAGRDFSSYDRILVNITCGTKVMSISTLDFFRKQKYAEIYYITPKSELMGYGATKAPAVLTISVSLEEYLKSYGFTVIRSTPSGVSAEQSARVFDHFKNLNLVDYKSEFTYLRERRKKEKGVPLENYESVEKLLSALDFTPVSTGSLSKEEVKYLTGEWFEEYIGQLVRSALGISEENLWIGTTLLKEIPGKKPKNSVTGLLGADAPVTNPDSKNEMDVMFMYRDQFYSIECKTSLLASMIAKDKNGNATEKEKIILGDTIYKSDSLQSKFGLHPKTFIFTLTDFQGYISEKDTNNRTNTLAGHINRANISGITLVDKSRLISEDIISILGIKKNAY